MNTLAPPSPAHGHHSPAGAGYGASLLSVAYAWFIAVALIGYPLVGVAVSVLGLDSQVITIPYRVGLLRKPPACCGPRPKVTHRRHHQ